MDDEILQEFLAESWESLGRLDTRLASLAGRPPEADVLAGIFRTLDAIKGTCGFIGLTRTGAVAHATVGVLARLRDGRLPATPGAMSLVHEAIGEIEALLTGLEATGEEMPRDNAGLLRRLNDFAATGHAAEGPQRGAAESTGTHSQPDSQQKTLDQTPSSGCNLSSLDVPILRASFQCLAPRADLFAQRFFEKLVADHPRLRPLFAQTDFADLRRKLIQAIVVVLRSLEQPEPLGRFLRELGGRHARYGVAAGDYSPFVETLHAAMAEFAGESWSDDVRHSWTAALQIVAGLMQEGARPHGCGETGRTQPAREIGGPEPIPHFTRSRAADGARSARL